MRYPVVLVIDWLYVFHTLTSKWSLANVYLLIAYQFASSNFLFVSGEPWKWIYCSWFHYQLILPVSGPFVNIFKQLLDDIVVFRNLLLLQDVSLTMRQLGRWYILAISRIFLFFFHYKFRSSHFYLAIPEVWSLVWFKLVLI